MGRRTKVESWNQWLEAETGDSHSKAELETGRPEANQSACESLSDFFINLYFGSFETERLHDVVMVS